MSSQETFLGRRALRVTSRLIAVPVIQRDAFAYIERHHRPVAQERQDGFTAEVTRLCTDGVDREVLDRHGDEHTIGISSFLYGRAARAAFAIAEVKGRSWDTPSRRRRDHHPIVDKLLWEPAR